MSTVKSPNRNSLPIITMRNPPAGAMPATPEQLLALGIPQSSIDAGEHRFETDTVYPWGYTRKIRAIVETAAFGEFSRKENVSFYSMRTMNQCREDGYCMRGYVSLGGKKYRAFTSDILFELPCGKLVKVAVLFASIR